MNFGLTENETLIRDSVRAVATTTYDTSQNVMLVFSPVMIQ